MTTPYLRICRYVKNCNRLTTYIQMGNANAHCCTHLGNQIILVLITQAIQNIWVYKVNFESL